MEALRKQIEAEEEIQKQLKTELKNEQTQTKEILNEVKSKTKDLNSVNKFYEQGKGDDSWEKLVENVKGRHNKMVDTLKQANFGMLISYTKTYADIDCTCLFNINCTYMNGYIY